MARNDVELPPIGRTSLGGAACGFTYNAALQDALAREERLRRPLRLGQWQNGPGYSPSSDMHRERTEPARSVVPA